MSTALASEELQSLSNHRECSFALAKSGCRILRQLFLKRLHDLTDGEIRINDPLGTVTLGQRTDLQTTLNIHNTAFFRHAVLGGSLSVAESYMRGDWDCEDLTSLFRIFVRNTHAMDRLNSGMSRIAGFFNRLYHRWHANSKSGSQRNIHAHYDLGNDFFQLILDETMAYSSGIFLKPNSTLYEASIEKMDRLCRKLNLQPGDHLLEIGTGWGGLAIHAASKYGCRVTTTTISKQQHEVARQRIEAAGLSDRVTLLLQDYRDLTGKFDKLVSVEMIEAVGHQFHDTYFRTCSELLKPNGSLVLQAIVMPDQRYPQYLRSVDFIQRYVFPGGCLTSMKTMLDSTSRATDLRFVHAEDFGTHYAHTLREWRKRFHASLNTVRELGYPDRFIRMWDYYLSYCEASFDERYASVVQIQFDKPQCQRDTISIGSMAADRELTMSMLSLSLDAVERGLVPDVITRAAIRKLCRRRLCECNRGDAAANTQAFEAFLTSMRSGPIAPVPEKANEQHYELPPKFFATVLGPHRKYSSCYWPTPQSTLAEAESAALEITCERAELRDGQDVLELGCGWGSLSLWMAEHFPNSRITAVSNSSPQRLYIESLAASRGIANLRVITADMNQFNIEANAFDRVVSVEMFEHMRNFEQLLGRIASWLRPEGRLFVHHFCHRDFLYPFEASGDANWMGRYFFTGGIMPNENMLRHFHQHMSVTQQWRWDGTHYQRTSEAWLRNMDANAAEVMPILTAAYGREEARRWFHRWRLFFLAVAELFGYAGGTEWFVAHSLLQPNAK